MRFLDISYEEPEKNLALDEVILESVESERVQDTLRLWESPVPFVVIGSGQRYRRVVNHFNCLRDKIPILRRCSAGGAVVQGKGSLNYALALRYSSYPEVSDLQESYAFILERLVGVFAQAGVMAQRAGISDLVVGGRKVSGNAQRRKRFACLHHGTLVYEVNHEGMIRYLLEPDERPEYRGKRTHTEFVGTLPVPVDSLCKLVCKAFGSGDAPAAILTEETQNVEELVRTKYSQNDWTFRR
ncbi:MAG: lipoate--protein ligase family protein [Candidatus Hydrogenedentes bacterium]|nr:lipoate--protein ligase family protein [Candidatus Hydrogenedentota bacterium]